MKFKTIFINSKYWANKLLNFIFSPPLKFFLKNEIGRSILYNSFPKDTLILCNTTENIKYIVNSSDKVIGRGTFKSQNSFDSINLEKSLKILNLKKKVLLDVGANIGSIGIYGVKKNYFKKCLAFEPEPKNFRLLKLNVFINNLNDQFELYNTALNDGTEKKLLFNLSKDNYGDHHISHESNIYSKKDREEIVVPCNTLDNLCKDLEMNEIILFMDTQGYEGHILSGSKSLIAASIPIVTEFWPYGLTRSNGKEKFYNALENTNYKNLYDLRFPDKKIEFNIQALEKIASDLGKDKDIFTDLLIF